MAYDVASAATEVSPAKTGDARGAITVQFVADKAEWDSLIASCPVPHLPQGFAYGEGKAAKGWTVRRALFVAGGRPVAIATVLELRRFGVRFLNRINRGPLFLEAAPSDERIVGVYAAIRRHWGRIWTAPLLIAPALNSSTNSSALLRRAGYRLRHDRSWQSGRIDLTVGDDPLWAGLAVVATPVGAVGDIVRDGETGLLVQPGDVDGLTAALTRLVEGKPLRDRLGAAALQLHREKLDLAPYAKAVHGVWITAAR